MSRTKKTRKYITEAISKLPSGKLLTSIVVVILLTVILYLIIFFLFL